MNHVFWALPAWKKKIVQKFRRSKISIHRGTDTMGWIIRTCPLLEDETKANPEPGLPRTLTDAKAKRAVPYRRVISLEGEGRRGGLLDSWRLYWLRARGYGNQSGPIKGAQLGSSRGLSSRTSNILNILCDFGQVGSYPSPLVAPIKWISGLIFLKNSCYKFPYLEGCSWWECGHLNLPT